MRQRSAKAGIADQEITRRPRNIAGLQKWVFDSGLGAWKLAYVLQAGLNLGTPYTIDHYPTGQNPKTSLPPACLGRRRRWPP